MPAPDVGILNTYLETRSLKRTAERLGMARETVRQRLHEMGVTFRHSLRESNRPRPRACEVCKRELPYRKTDYPHRYARKRFCSQQCVGRANTRSGRPRKLTDQQVLEAYRQAPSAYQAALALKVGPNTVYEHLKALGIDYRRRSG